MSSSFFHSWNTITDGKQIVPSGPGYSYRPDRYRPGRAVDRSIILTIYNRLGVDVSALEFRHVKIDATGRYISDVNSGLNTCLTKEANIDQSGRAFIQDVAMSMFDEGCVCVVPVETDARPDDGGTFKIKTLRTAKITQWFPKEVQVEIYNELTGQKELRFFPKSTVAIIENPFFSIMNEPNSTLKRLLKKIALVDKADDEASSGKLDLIIQLPYTIKSPARKKQAEERRKDIEMQLANTKYGIAYTDGTERITQLNRAVENNLPQQIDVLTKQLYNQLGLTENIFNGTASETEQVNYLTNTIEPIASAIANALTNRFISKTAYTQGHRIMHFRNPFKLATLTSITGAVDAMTRNEVMTSNDFRSVLGFKPVDSARADQLKNKNISDSNYDDDYDLSDLYYEDDSGEDEESSYYNE